LTSHGKGIKIVHFQNEKSLLEQKKNNVQVPNRKRVNTEENQSFLYPSTPSRPMSNVFGINELK
jgi:hypothetical protein